MTDIPVDIVIYALVAAGLIFWLRSVLGTRHGDEPQRPNPFVTSEDKKEAGEQKNVINIDGSEVKFAENNMYDPFADETIAPNIAVRETLRDIARKDREFDPVKFLKNAEEAFVMIVEAYADGDKEFLKPLLAENVYESFELEIDRRRDKGEHVQTEIHAIRKSEITGAKLDGKMAYVFVNIQAEETCVIKDANEKIVEGNPNRATEMNDIWVFGRNLRSKNPVWQVYETHDGVPEDHKTPIPEVT